MPRWNGVTDRQVLVIEPNRRLSYSWNASGSEAVNGLKTVVTWTLARTGNGTLVRMDSEASAQRMSATIEALTMAGGT